VLTALLRMHKDQWFLTTMRVIKTFEGIRKCKEFLHRKNEHVDLHIKFADILK
jgi:hypothetical protein